MKAFPQRLLSETIDNAKSTLTLKEIRRNQHRPQAQIFTEDGFPLSDNVIQFLSNLPFNDTDEKIIKAFLDGDINPAKLTDPQIEYLCTDLIDLNGNGLITRSMLWIYDTRADLRKSIALTGDPNLTSWFLFHGYEEYPSLFVWTPKILSKINPITIDGNDKKINCNWFLRALLYHRPDVSAVTDNGKDLGALFHWIYHHGRNEHKILEIIHDFNDFL